MIDLQLPLLSYQQQLKLRSHDSQTQLFCIVRKKWVQLNPEEVVRQLFLHYMLDKGFSSKLMKLEQKIQIPESANFYRADIIVYNRALEAKILVECKSANEKITEEVLKQISRYNQLLNIDYLLVTNGVSTIAYQRTTESSIINLSEFPTFTLS